MKNFKLNVKTIIIILIFSFILLNSCENDLVKTNELENITSIEIKEIASPFSKYFESKETMASAFEKSSELRSKTSDEDQLGTIYVNMSADEVHYRKEDLANIYSDKQKEFLLLYFNRIGNINNGELLTEITYYKDLLEEQLFEEEEYNQIYSILDVAEQTVIIINEMLPKEGNIEKDYEGKTGDWSDFLRCVGGEGKSIARGLVAGAIGGAIWGSGVGATGGTVVLPIVGTATGAVGGAVFGAAGGAVVGALGATLWAAADCLGSFASSGQACLYTGGTNNSGSTHPAACME